jgi:hypothetical protein
MARLSARDRRTLIVGAVSVSLVFGLGRGLPAWLRWRHDVHASSLELTRELHRARASLTQRKLLQDSLSPRRKRFIALAPMLLRGHTTAMGGASLAALISTASTASSTRLGPVRVEPDTAARGVFTRVRVRAELTGDVRGVAAFLQEIERGVPLLAVRELQISQLEPAAAPDRAEALRAAMTVEGLMLTPRAPADSASRLRGHQDSVR